MLNLSNFYFVLYVFLPMMTQHGRNLQEECFVFILLTELYFVLFFYKHNT